VPTLPSPAPTVKRFRRNRCYLGGMLRLHGFSHSSSTWRVRIALELKGVAYEQVIVDVRREEGQQHDPAFERLNPARQIPVLEWDEGGSHRTLGQSMAILRYLEAIEPAPALWPQDAYLGAHATQLAELVNSGIQPLQNNRVLGRLAALGVEEHAWAREVIARGLAALEASATLAADFLVGNGPTVADLYAVPQLYNARRFGVDLDPFPTLLRSEASCLQLLPFTRTHPDA